ncbi:hypothetical protein JCM14124_18440 [Humidesulfovibrio idahonensis]
MDRRSCYRWRQDNPGAHAENSAREPGSQKEHTTQRERRRNESEQKEGQVDGNEQMAEIAALASRSAARWHSGDWQEEGQR